MIYYTEGIPNSLFQSCCPETSFIVHIFLSLKIRLPSVTDTCLTAALLPGVLYGRCYKKMEEEKKKRKEKKRSRKESEKKKRKKEKREKSRFDMSGSFDNNVAGGAQVGSEIICRQ